MVQFLESVRLQFTSRAQFGYPIFVRAETDRAKLEAFMAALGGQVQGPGEIYLTGGATALLYSWRAMTIDVVIKPDPGPRGLFEAIARLKEELDINVELASPDQFVPAIPGWRERSVFIAQYGQSDSFITTLMGRSSPNSSAATIVTCVTCRLSCNPAWFVQHVCVRCLTKSNPN